MINFKMDSRGSSNRYYATIWLKVLN